MSPQKAKQTHPPKGTALTSVNSTNKHSYINITNKLHKGGSKPIPIPQQTEKTHQLGPYKEASSPSSLLFLLEESVNISTSSKFWRLKYISTLCSSSPPSFKASRGSSAARGCPLCIAKALANKMPSGPKGAGSRAQASPGGAEAVLAPPVPALSGFSIEFLLGFALIMALTLFLGEKVTQLSLKRGILRGSRH
uniref:Uncharacterized protein n=1 Tax=Opuntia streptacantha TaxID=393608 RepID=A0A7C9B1E7_OPUST